MTTILLVIIYIAFISLGLPDSILGSAWPVMYEGLQVSISYVGILSMIIAGGTIISSFFSGKIIQKLGTGLVTTISVGMTAMALMGFSFSSDFWQLCLWGIPYGLGAGSVDAALNHFVALHYKSRHMSWLHCFWGVGATVGPYIMGLCLTNHFSWTAGYQTIGMIQIVLVILIALSLPLWKMKQKEGAEENVGKALSLKEILALPGALQIFAAFFAYCAVESTAGLWASSYMVFYKGIHVETAAKWASFFYLGITIGRFIGGFITDYFGDKVMIRIGQGIALVGILLILLPASHTVLFIGLILIGIGCAPIYPSIIHQTPNLFGKENSQAIIGIQMASAYIGTTFMPPLFGVIANVIGIMAYPWYLIIFTILLIVMVEKCNHLQKVREGKSAECL